VRTQRYGELDVYVGGGDDGIGGGDGPLVVLLHGFGAPGDDLVPLARYLRAPAGTRFVFPAAPLEMPGLFGDSRAWWMLDLEELDRAMASGAPRDLSGAEPEGMAEARDQLIAMLEHAARDLGAAPERTVLGGFSQGSMLSCDVVLRTDRAFAGLVLLSSTVVNQPMWAPRMAARAGLPVFQSHGTSDALLPFSAAVRLRDLLGEAGLSVEWHEFAGGHEIPPQILAGVGQFLQRVLA
jgi:phospholipase/carboxylesterase